MKKILVILFAALGLYACEDFLQQEPQDFAPEESYFYTSEDLAKAANKFYKLFPGNSVFYGGIFEQDNKSDNQTGFGSVSDFYEGNKLTPAVENSEWKFESIREANYFINLVAERKAKKQMIGSEADINHYWGEFYFFRAYDYFRLLSKIGDAPIITRVLYDENEELKANSKRRPRNEVARFILNDLDIADSLMQSSYPEPGRVYKDCAILMKARVALFEATWLKYHQGTAFVPGNPKWVGNREYPNYEFPSGSLENEINFFLEKAIEAADIIASQRNLYSDYPAMFNSRDTYKIPEVILAKSYQSGVNGHSVVAYLQGTGGGTGYTRSMVESFLMKDGLPYYASNSYMGDTSLVNVAANRDERLVKSMNVTGDVNRITAAGKTEYVPLPRFLDRTVSGCPTGYEVRKWSTTDPNDAIQSKGTTDSPVFRAAEAYLIYLEAYYERYHDLGGNCDKYWKALRTRAGVDPDYMKTINATIIAPVSDMEHEMKGEHDLAAYSKGIAVDKTLYNIRRERRCEFIAEGMRYNDLRRWRSLDLMKNYVTEGMNLWEQFYTRYYAKDKKTGQIVLALTPQLVSQRDVSTYVRVFQVFTTDKAYNGYNFPKPHYLEPIPVNEIIMTSENSDPNTSPIYQNPGWPNFISGPADYTYDCD